ncbi:MAG: hypothetical protein KA084_01160 [Brachymonas sp.]|nr:hypothetical protein [Brachymonas sp.]
MDKGMDKGSDKGIDKGMDKFPLKKLQKRTRRPCPHMQRTRTTQHGSPAK